MATPLQQIKDIWNRLPMSGRISTISAAVATLGLISALIYYGSRAEYGVLFSDLKPADAQTIVEKLKAANVPYQLVNNGTAVQVPSERISELRLQMASSGILSGGHVGFDLFDKTNFGATDFAQQVNFRRAIEGELSKTLEGMDEVESVRVHITPKKESVFTEKEEGAKASVMLRVRQGKELSEERTEAIVNLISSSVEGLDPSSVSVMDTRGRVLTNGRGKKNGLNDSGSFQSQLESKQKYEAENTARIIALLEPVVGEGKVHANVSADVDFSQTEQTEEKYDPKSQVVRSQQNVKETKTSSNITPAANPVGARSNDPTAQPTPVPPAQQNQQSGNDDRNSSTTNYEIDKITKRTVGGGGRVNRMTVSVVVDYKNANGVDVARTAEEIKQMQDLVSAAVGFDQNRGDSVVVQTMAFNKLPDEGASNANWFDRNKQFVASSVKYVALVLVALLLLFFVVRPARRSLKVALTQPTEPPLLSAAPPEDIEKRNADESLEQLAEKEMGELKPMITVAELEAQIDSNSEDSELNEKIQRAEKVKQMVAEQTLNNPEMVVSTLRGWLRDS